MLGASRGAIKRSRACHAQRACHVHRTGFVWPYRNIKLSTNRGLVQSIWLPTVALWEGEQWRTSLNDVPRDRHSLPKFYRCTVKVKHWPTPIPRLP